MERAPAYLHAPTSVGDEVGKVRTALRAFCPIALAEMDTVALQDRQETKFVFDLPLLVGLLPALAHDYRVLAVEGEQISRYRTLYFDTPELDLFRCHQVGKPTRFKVRSREYVESHTSFLEVKKRTNRKRTLKRRLMTDGLLTSLEGANAGFVGSEFPFEAESLVSVLWNHYQRITLVGRTCVERITIDLSLDFAGAGDFALTGSASLPGVVIAEVKQPRITRDSPFVASLRAAHIRPTSFSKYCMGVTMLVPGVAQNRYRRQRSMVRRMAPRGPSLYEPVLPRLIAPTSLAHTGDSHVYA